MPKPRKHRWKIGRSYWLHQKTQASLSVKDEKLHNRDVKGFFIRIARSVSCPYYNDNFLNLNRHRKKKTLLQANFASRRGFMIGMVSLKMKTGPNNIFETKLWIKKKLTTRFLGGSVFWSHALPSSWSLSFLQTFITPWFWI